MANRSVNQNSFSVRTILFFSALLIFPYFLIAATRPTKIIAGAENLQKYLPILKDKNVGLVVNHSSLVFGNHLVDTLIALGISVKKIFSPEHGFRGVAEAGGIIEDEYDENTRLPVISLYGKKHKPDSIDLLGLDIIVFDIQDVGVRFYTYISTLHYIMESCAENNLPLLVLDRPNPNANYIDGPVLDTAFKSFIGIHPIPVVYGLTIGELALMILGECWILNCDKLELKIIPCLNYKRSMRVILQVRPSPNLPNELAVRLYPSLCFFEGTLVSVGRGTDYPFQIYGHPTMHTIDSFSFIPRSSPFALNPPWKDQLCFGVDLRKIKFSKAHAERKINISYLLNAFREHKSDTGFFLKNHFFDKLAGTDKLRIDIQNNRNEVEIRKSWEPDLKEFRKRSRKYYIYR